MTDQVVTPTRDALPATVSAVTVDRQTFTAQITFTGPYAGQWAKVDLNPPRKTFRKLSSGDEGVASEALACMVIDHALAYNGVVVARPLTADALDDLPTFLVADLTRAIVDGMAQVAEVPSKS